MHSLMNFGPDFNRFSHEFLLEKIFHDTRETGCWTILFSDSHDSACLIYIISHMFPQVVLSSLTLLWHFEESCFRKDIF